MTNDRITKGKRTTSCLTMVLKFLVAQLLFSWTTIAGAAQLTPNQVAHYRCALIELEQAQRFITPVPELLYVRGRSHQALAEHTQAVEAYAALLNLRPGDQAARTCRDAARNRSTCALADGVTALVSAWHQRPNLAETDEDLYRRAQRSVDAFYPGDGFDVIGSPPFRRIKSEMADGNFNIALVLYDKMAELIPGYAPAIEGRGNVFAAQGRFDKAIAEFTRVIGMLPTIDETLAAIVEHDARWRRGEELADTGSKIMSEFRAGNLGSLISAYEARGYAYAKLGRLDEAWADYLRVLDIVPEHDAARRALEKFRPFLEAQSSLIHGSAPLRQVPHENTASDRPISRLKEYRYIVDRYGPNLKSSSSRYRLPWRGQDYVHRGMHDTAHEHFRRYLALNLGYDGAWRYLGDLHMAMNDHDAALQNYTRAVEASNSPSWLYEKRALAYSALGKLDLAIADYSKYINMYKKGHSPTIGSRALLYAEIGRHDLAVADLKVYLEGDTSHPTTYHYLAESLAMLGAFDKALEHEAEAVKLAPRYAAAYELKALMHYVIASNGLSGDTSPACYHQPGR